LTNIAMLCITEFDFIISNIVSGESVNNFVSQ